MEVGIVGGGRGIGRNRGEGVDEFGWGDGERVCFEDVGAEEGEDLEGAGIEIGGGDGVVLGIVIVIVIVIDGGGGIRVGRSRRRRFISPSIMLNNCRIRIRVG